MFKELLGIVRKTMGTPEVIRTVLSPIAGRIPLALVYGSVAHGFDRADSDVDVLIVSDDLTLEELYRRFARAERTLRRKINPTLLTTSEFRRRRSTHNPFLENVLSRDRIVLIGSEDAVRGSEQAR